MKTVKPRAIISLVAGVILMTGCATKSEIDVSTDYSMANFDQFTSYQWLPEGESKGHKPENNLITDRITGSINENLSSKGYHQADTKPDVFVDFSVTTAAKVNIDNNQTYEGYAPGFTWSRGYGAQATQSKVGVMETSIVEYTEGSLMIDIIDPNNMQIIWRGIGTNKLPEQYDRDLASKLINKAVMATLENYPPPVK
jgi:hypothetical protein